jgi:GntR family histidine utilization transcriptional repressor
MTTHTLPAYEHVKAFIKAKINSGAWRAGDAVPSESSLQQQFGLSRMTVNRAVKELAVEGLVQRIRGSGTVVAQLHRISSTLAMRDIKEEIQERGHVHTSTVVCLEKTKADVVVAAELGLRKGARVFHSILVHSEDGIAIQLEDRWVNPASAPGYMEVDFSSTTPTHYLLAHAPLTEARFAIEATVAGIQEAKLLKINRREPCLVVTRRTVSGRHVASQARLVYPGNRYSLSGIFQI